MRGDWELFARGAAAAEDLLREVYGQEVRKALNPLKLRDFEHIVRSLSLSLRGQAVPVEDSALKAALGKLDARWTDMGPEARAKVINEAARYLGPPVAAKVLPRVDQTLAFAAKDIVPATKKNAVLTYDLRVSPNLNATDERIARYVRASQGHFIRNRYGERMDQFAEQARDIVASGLERGSGSADIADRLHAELGSHVERGLAYWNTIAMVFANRARTMTQLASFHEAGITAYVWESVLDEATSVQCRFMHGKRFPVAAAMQRFDSVENADSPEAVKDLQPFMSLGRDGDRAALVFGRDDGRRVAAHVIESGEGQRDEVGSYANALDDDGLAAAGVTTPPIHGNCRSTIIPEFGSVGGGGRRIVVPPPPLPPPPERLTPGARKAKALEDLEAVPVLEGGGGDAAAVFARQNLDPAFLEHPLFADPDAGGALGAQWAANATTKRPQLDDLIATAPSFDKGVVEKLVQKPKALGDAPAPKIVKYEGKLYVLDGHEQLAAQKLLGQKTANCEYVNLDAKLKPAPLVAPVIAPPPPPPPAVVVPKPPPPPPKKQVDVVPPPPPPRLFTIASPAPPDPKQAKAIEAAAKKDAALFPEGRSGYDEAATILAAQKKFKAQGRGRNRGDSVVSPLTPGKPEPGLDPMTALYRANLDGTKQVEGASVKQRILVDDYVAESNVVYRSYAHEAVSELVRNGGAFLERDAENPYRDGSPVVIRIGDKLYPYQAGKADVQLAAAKALRMQTLEARVVDVNPALAAHAAKENAEAFARQAARDKAHAEEVERVRAAAEARAARELVGPPDVVAVREKHQPAAYAAKFEQTYQEAAPSMGWGHAMQERGLDFSGAHLRRLSDGFAKDREHPLREVYRLIDRHVGTKQSIRQVLEDEAASPTMLQSDLRELQAAAAILGHVDAIQAHDEFRVGKHDAKVGPKARTQKQLNWLAALTDRSVSVPEKTNILLAKSGRAACYTDDITSWKGRTIRIELKKDEDTKTVFHEFGHALESSDRGRGQRASAFLDARTAGETVRPLHALTGNSAYRTNEVARPDKFASPYVGKDYGREAPPTNKYADPYYGPKAPQKGVEGTDQTHRSTEVTSMAIEKLGYWHRAYAEDPEHFLFGLGQLGGL